MSDFMPRDTLPDLWEEILTRHWTFLEKDGSMQKIEEGKKLESCLKEFLCIVPHDRKFFLPETAYVLGKSVQEMDDFNAYRAIIGFRSISQYANNLFTKPWRKEFRVLKMYSGFYNHEVKCNLLDPEKLFEAMGYRRISNEILVLHDPICPDQVTNVSRDAMAAYVECQIIEQIYAGLITLGLTCSWQDVFRYREKFVGGSSQAIKGLAYSIQEKRRWKETFLNADKCYASTQHLPQSLNITPITSECPNCVLSSPTQFTIHSDNDGTCPFHTKAATTFTNQFEPGRQKIRYSGYGLPLAGMQHSRSLDHYSEPVAKLPHRHSFDHQQKGCTAHHYKPLRQPHPQHVYEPPYDCFDVASVTGSSVSYAAVVSSGAGSNNVNNCGIIAAYAHAYNASGNRYQLPFNISNQLNSHYATPNVTCNGIKNELYNNLDKGGSAKVYNCNCHQPPLPPIRQSCVLADCKDFQAYRQRSFPADHQLNEFDDITPLKPHDYHKAFNGSTYCNSFEYDDGIERQREQDKILIRMANISSPYAHPKDIAMRHQFISHTGLSSASQQPSSDDMYGDCLYAQPLPKADLRKFNISSTDVTQKYERNINNWDQLDNNDKQMHLQAKELKDNNASLNGVGGGPRKIPTHVNEVSDNSEHPTQCSPTQASKNQDGVGSFESWHGVFQNLDRSGYSKDLGERGDLLVQSLDLDSMNLSNNGIANNNAPRAATERRRSNHVEEKKVSRQNNDIIKARTLEKRNTAAAPREDEKRDEKKEKSVLKHPVKKTKSGLKQTSQSATSLVHDNKNGNSEFQKDKNVITKNRKQVGVNTQATMNGLNEWSCNFCTFLNPDAKRICEMCSRSKDVNLEAAVSHLLAQ